MSMDSSQFLQEEKHKYSHYFKDICAYASCIRKRHEFYYELYLKLNKILKSTMKSAPSFSKLKEINKTNDDITSAPGVAGSQTENTKTLFSVFDTIVVLSNEFLSIMNVEIFNVFKTMSAYEKDLLRSEKLKVRNAKAQRKSALLAYRSLQKQLSDLHVQIEKEKQNSPSGSVKLKTTLCRYFSILSETKLVLTELNLLHSKYVKCTEESINKIRVSVVQHVTEMKSIFFATVPFIINYTKRIDILIDLIEKLKPVIELNWEDDFKKFIIDQKLTRTPRPLEIFNTRIFSFVDQMFMRPSIPLFCYYEAFPLYIATSTEKYTPQEKTHLEVDINEKVFLLERPNYEYTLVSKPNKNIIGYVPTKILNISNDKILMSIKPQIKTKEDKLNIQSNHLLVQCQKEINGKAVLCEDEEGNKGNVDLLNLTE